MYAVPPLSHAFLSVYVERVWFDMLQLLIGVRPPVLPVQPHAGLQQSQ
jgi:hypothetical protein